MLPLLLEICLRCLLRVKPWLPLNDVLFSRWYHPPFRWFSEDAASLNGTIWRVKNKPPEIGMFHEKVGVVL